MLFPRTFRLPYHITYMCLLEDVRLNLDRGLIRFLPALCDLAQSVIGAWSIRPLELTEQAGVVEFLERVAGVVVTLTHGLVGGLR